ncbi:4Fe-4S ferredoxin, iron-sulfur binding [Helicobacter heilmannii]|uniref:YfhL family 4Fe-4S dicluster ferredoxin n=1 Tax=Helicobacter TaxID=209 RepID=UPI0006A0B771|nr:MULTISPECIES: YfhL family 4Fe-4S dicluster ferredoxin [Helicobacter]BEG58109.1 Ferredoxin [Helicobacter sp. NHP21005]CRF47577.1 4Fe-4S ferredoxin, iron-sulfur binding [Helicobacter heilmannii]
MSLLVSQECIACDACREECPTEAIDESDPIYCIDPDRCTECVGYSDEPSCVGICPVDAIVPDPNNAETQEELQYKYESLREEI